MAFSFAAKLANAQAAVQPRKAPLARLVAWVFVILGFLFSLVWSGGLVVLAVKLFEFT
jgi:hypothetical protein